MLIGLCGKPNSGKSEIRYLLENLGFQGVNTKRALAMACHELTGVPLASFLDQEGKATLYKGQPLRSIMGKVQNAVEDMFGDYHTVEAALNQYDIHGSQNLVLDSLRKTQPLYFPGFVVEVVSDSSIDTGNGFDIYSRDKIDYQLVNNGSFENLEKSIIKMLDELGLKL